MKKTDRPANEYYPGAVEHCDNTRTLPPMIEIKVMLQYRGQAAVPVTLSVSRDQIRKLLEE